MCAPISPAGSPEAVDSAATGPMNTQRLATVFDGIARHSPEGMNFRKRAGEVGILE